jgi:hypothetical protein
VKAAAGAMIVRELKGILRREVGATGRLISVVPAGPFGTDSLPPMVDVFEVYKESVLLTCETNKAVRAGGVIVGHWAGS